MRILHIIGTLSPEAGGPAEVVRMLTEFAPADIVSEIVTLDTPGTAFLTAYRCPVHALGPARYSYEYSPSLPPWLQSHRDRFDGVIVHGLWTYPGVAAWRALRWRVPYVVFAHGMLDPYFKHEFPLKHAKKWVYWVLAQYWVLRGASRVLFTTARERDLARQSFWLSRWEALVTPLGTEPAAEATTEAREAFFTLCPGVRGHRFLLFLGRIHPKKGCDLLVEAFARCAAKDKELHLVMAGPDPSGWGRELAAVVARAGVEQRIHWPGMVHSLAKTGAFDVCEAFILPSHQENFGIAVVEALAAGRPVLLSDKIDIAAEIDTAECGLVETDTVEGTVRLLDRWLALSPGERSAMGRRALETFETLYDMRRNAESILRALPFGGHTGPDRT